MKQKHKERLVKTPQMAAECGFSKGTLRDLRRKKVIPSIQVNRRLVLYSPEKVIQALERLSK
jgi:predicted DNA-binding transcriptional regulator AlpA